MNIVRELRKKKGIQQKELAIEIGVSIPTVSNWEKGKSDPSGERLKKLAAYFGVDELFILGYGLEKPTAFVPENPAISGTSETEQIVQYVLNRLNVPQEPQSEQITIVSTMMQRMTKDQQEQVVDVVRAMFKKHPELLK